VKHEKLKGILAAVAPKLALAIGGPLAGIAAQAITSKLTGEPVSGLDQLEAVLDVASPADFVKLKEVEAEFATQMKRAGIDLAKIDADDRDSARDRQVRMKDWTPSILGLAIILGFFGVLAYIFKYGLPDEGSDVLLIMVGSLGVMTSSVGNYFFGSSAGSKSKDVMIADLKKAG
jgi:hypothetical protein